MIRIPVFTDFPGWQGARLKEAFAKRGYSAEFMSIKSCGLSIEAGNPRVIIPGFNEPPAGVFVRGVPGGTVQQVISRLNILHTLESDGVAVYNDAGMVERTVDKAATSLILSKAGVSTPATWVCESRHLAEEVIGRETSNGRSLVIKPLFGSQGDGVIKVKSVKEMPIPMGRYVDGVYYMQEYIDSGEGAWHDYRVFIVNDKVVGAMSRHGSGWVNNVAQGGRCEPISKSGDIAKLALAAAKAVNIHYCGVDVIKDVSGRLYVLEVNSIPAWRGLQGVENESIAQLMVDDFTGRVMGNESA